MNFTDPLVGIIIALGIIVLFSLFSFFKTRYRDKQRSKSLQNLAKSYEFAGLASGVEEFLSLSNNPIPTLQFIADAYIKSGNTQDAIKIYLSILDNLKHTNKDSKIKIEILQNLGTAYYGAGFLQRAKDIFLEILKHYPRNPNVLHYLLKTYERLNEYKNALEVLKCIEEIYDESQNTSQVESSNIALNKAYINTLLIINQHDLPLSQKIKQLNHIKDVEPRLEKIILSFFKSASFSLFWEEISKSHNIAHCIDILWDFKQTDIPLDAITNAHILDVYRAKGFVVDDRSCDVFVLENMRILKRYSKLKADLSFEYRCHSCKHIFPFEYARCANCGELLNSDVICKIREIKDEASYFTL